MVVAMRWLAAYLGIRQVKVPPVLFWGWKVVKVTGWNVQCSLAAGRSQVLGFSWAFRAEKGFSLESSQVLMA